MASAKDNLNKEYRNWVRLFILIDYGVKKLCYDVFFKKENWPTDGVQLYRRLKSEQSIISQLINKHQIICLSIGFTDHRDFDLTLFTSIMKVIFGSKYQSLVKDLRNLGNQECHISNKQLPDTNFGTIWKCTADILENHSFDFSLVHDLKDFDLFSDQRVEDIVICIQG